MILFTFILTIRIVFTFANFYRAKDYYESVDFTVYTATWNVAGSNTVIEKSDIVGLLFRNDNENEDNQYSADRHLLTPPSSSTTLPQSFAKSPFADIYCIAFQETVDLSTMNVVFDDSKAVERSNYLANLIEEAFKSKGCYRELFDSRCLFVHAGGGGVVHLHPTTGLFSTPRSKEMFR